MKQEGGIQQQQCVEQEEEVLQRRVKQESAHVYADDCVKQETTQASSVANDTSSSTESEFYDDEPEDEAEEAPIGSSSNSNSIPFIARPAAVVAASQLPHAPIVWSDSYSRCSSRLMSVSGERVQLCMCCDVQLLAAFEDGQQQRGTRTKKSKIRRCRECQGVGKQKTMVRILDDVRSGVYKPEPNSVVTPKIACGATVHKSVAVSTTDKNQTMTAAQKRKRTETQTLKATDSQVPDGTKKQKQIDPGVAGTQASGSDESVPGTQDGDGEDNISNGSIEQQPESCARCSNQLPRVEGPSELFCACCKVKFAASAFSRSQAAKERVIRRCQACVKGGASIYEELKNEPVLGGAMLSVSSAKQTKRMAIEKQNEARAKRADNVHKLVSVKRLPRITRSQAAVLKKKQKPMNEEQQLEFAVNMRKLVYGRKEYFLQLGAADKKKEVTKAEQRELQRKDQQLHSLEKKLFVQNQQLFNELYKVIK